MFNNCIPILSLLFTVQPMHFKNHTCILLNLIIQNLHLFICFPKKFLLFYLFFLVWTRSIFLKRKIKNLINNWNSGDKPKKILDKDSPKKCEILILLIKPIKGEKMEKRTGLIRWGWMLKSGEVTVLNFGGRLSKLQILYVIKTPV